MKNFFKILAICAFGFMLPDLNSFGQKSPLDYVNLFIGTAGDHGQLDPAACVPFGLVKPGPDTDPGNHSGYDFNAKKVAGFSINRLSGTGCKGVGGNLRIRPAVSATDTNMLIDKASEFAKPGYYSITYLNSRIKTELTATNSVALQRYTFPTKGSAWLWINPASSFETLYNYAWKQKNKFTLTGSFESGNVCNKGRYKQFYTILFDQEILETESENGQLKFRFETPGILNVHVFVSPIDPEYALNNGMKELKERGFDEISKAASSEWLEALSKVKLKGKEEDKTLFYTFLYRTMLSPVRTSGFDNFYKGTDGLMHKSSHIQYHSWSMWDTYRNKFSLFSLVYSDKMKDFAHSLVQLYKEGKVDWATNQEPVPTVRTEHSQIVLLDAYRKGLLPKSELEAVFPFMEKEAEMLLNKTPDQKLETAYDFWALSAIAGILGNKEKEEMYKARCQEYRTIYKEKFATMDKKSDIMHGDGMYEGTRWQYRWATTFDIGGMIEMQGGKDAFTAQLEQFFDSSYFSAGNEPDIQTPYLFNYSTKPWLTQKWLNTIFNQVSDNRYGTHAKWKKPVIRKVFQASPEGMLPEMDDDDGTMSAWYVWSSLGLYPLLVGEPGYEIGLPLFEESEIFLANGKSLRVVTKGREKGLKIKKMKWNGKNYSSLQIPHDKLLQGGKLEIEF